MSGDLARRVREHLVASGLMAEPGVALVAVSGGPDSVALLDLLARLTGPLRLDLAVAHVDHGIREDSGEVAEQVMALAVRYGVPGHLASLRLGAGASETAARRLRYRALRRVQRDIGARYLVTAHHADDQAETVLFRMLRGSGIAGLAGIGATGPLGLVRPLLPFRKAELAAWIRGRGDGVPIPVHEDPANLDLRHDRSWIRRELVPAVVDRFGPRAVEQLLDVARHARRDREAWSAVLRHLPALSVRRGPGWIEVARPPLRRYDEPLAHALLGAVAREAGCVLGPSRAATLWRAVADRQSGRTFQLGGGWIAETVFEGLRIRRPEAAPAPPPARLALASQDDGRQSWGPWTIAWRREPAGELVRGGWTTWVTVGDAVVRSREPGDRVRPLGSTVRRRLSAVLMEARVPRGERPAVPILVRGGEVVWVPGVCRAHAAMPAPGTMAVRLDVFQDRNP